MASRQEALEAVYDVALGEWETVLSDVTYKTKTIRVPPDTLPALLAVAEGEDGAGFPPKLEGEVEEAIGGLGGKAFFKLGTRSPKDAVLDFVHPRTEREILAVWEARSAGGLDDGAWGSDNRDLVAYVSGCMRALVAESVEDVVWLMVSSLRIRQDLRAAMANRELQVDLVFRDWHDMGPADEFRVFVSDGKVTAISQYFHFVVLPELQAPGAEDRVRSAIQTLWAESVDPVADQLPCRSYTADVMIDGNGKAWITELNPFGPVAGPCCFSWVDDADLLNGADPCVVRFANVPVKDARIRFMSGAWDKWFQRSTSEIPSTQSPPSTQSSDGCTIQ